MTFTKWASVALVGGSVSVLVGACAREPAPPESVGTIEGAVRDAELSITPVGGTCPEQCFRVTSGTGKNITHIFVDTRLCDAPEPVDPEVRCGPSLASLRLVRPDPKLKGGPCPLPSPHPIERELWFPLTGNQSDVYCCVLPTETSEVLLGAKAKGECHVPASSDACCVPSTLPDAGAGGAGGSGGAGGCTYTPVDL